MQYHAVYCPYCCEVVKTSCDYAQPNPNHYCRLVHGMVVLMRLLETLPVPSRDLHLGLTEESKSND